LLTIKGKGKAHTRRSSVGGRSSSVSLQVTACIVMNLMPGPQLTSQPSVITALSPRSRDPGYYPFWPNFAFFSTVWCSSCQSVCQIWRDYFHRYPI